MAKGLYLLSPNRLHRMNSVFTVTSWLPWWQTHTTHMSGIVRSLVKSSSASSFGDVGYLLRSSAHGSFRAEEKPPQLCCRVVLRKNPLPIWPEFCRGPRLAHDFTVHVKGAGNRTPSYSSGAPPTPSLSPLQRPPTFLFTWRESMRSSLTLPLYLSRLGYPPAPTPTDPTWCQCCITATTATERQRPTLKFSPSGLLLQRTDSEKSVQPHRRPLFFSSL